MSENKTAQEILLSVAEEIINTRAARDGWGGKEYDTIHDPEGYITSILTSLIHWCQTNGISWKEELNLAQGFFQQDMAEAESGGESLSDPKVNELRCPACGHDESFVIEAAECLLMFSDGSIFNGDCGMEWGNHSYCRCHECNHTGTVFQFRKDQQQQKKENGHG